MASNQVYVSKRPDLDQFKAMYPDVNVVIDVSDEGSIYCNKFYAGLGVSYFWFPMSERTKDMGLSSMFGALVVLDDARKKKLNVLLHCVQGQNRSVSVYEAYLDMIGDTETERKGKLLENSNGVQLPRAFAMNVFLSKVKEYVRNKSKLVTGPLDWCKEALE